MAYFDLYGVEVHVVNDIALSTPQGAAYGWGTFAIHGLVSFFQGLAADRFDLAGHRVQLVARINQLIRGQRFGEAHPRSIFDGVHSQSIAVVGQKYGSYFRALREILHGVLAGVAGAFSPDWCDVFPTPCDALERIGILAPNRKTAERIAQELRARWGLTPAKMCAELWRIEAGLTSECKSTLAILEADVIASSPRTIVLTDLQKRIRNALDRKALKKLPLGSIVCGGEASRLYRPGGIKELMAAGLVAKARGVGYYRPDAPPPGLIVRVA